MKSLHKTTLRSSPLFRDILKLNLSARLFSSATIINSRFKEAYNKHREHFEAKYILYIRNNFIYI